MPPNIPRKTLGRFRKVRDRKPLYELMSSTPLLGTTLKNYRVVSMDWLPVYHFPEVVYQILYLFCSASGGAWRCERCVFAQRLCFNVSQPKTLMS